MRPPAGEYLHYFDRYIALVPDADIVDTLSAQPAAIRRALTGLSPDAAGARYASGKWNVREVLGHLIDTERVMAFRAFWIARGSEEGLPGFDQEPFAGAAGHDRVPLPLLIDEFCCVRESHLYLFRELDPEAWTRVGRVDGHPFSVRAAAWIMAGHVIWHARALAASYGIPISDA